MSRRGGKRRRAPRIRAMRAEAPANLGRPYDRRRDLPRLVPVLEADIADDGIAARADLLALLRRALRAERARARGGHWTYDPGRHAGLLRAYLNERAALRERVRRHVGRCGCPGCSLAGLPA